MAAHEKKLLLGAGILTAAFFIGTVQNVLIKLIAQKTSISMIVFVQYAVCLFMLLPYSIGKRTTLFKAENTTLLVIRALSGLIYFFSMFYALNFTPLVDVALLSNAAPLWVPIIGLIFLHQRIHSSIYLAIIIGFFGVGLILLPNGGIASKGSLFALISGIAMAISLVTTKQLSDKEMIHRVLFYYFAIATLAMLPMAIMHSQNTDLVTWSIIILNGILMGVQQVLLYYGFRFGPATKLSISTYSAVIFAALFDWLIWHHMITLTTFLGAILIILAAIRIFLPHIFRKKSKSAAVNLKSSD